MFLAPKLVIPGVRRGVDLARLKPSQPIKFLEVEAIREAHEDNVTEDLVKGKQMN